MSDWQNAALGEILDVHNGYAFKSKDFLDQGVPVIKIKNVKPNTILLDTLSYVSEEIANQKSRYLIKPDDILITMSGNRFDGSPETWVGKVALFKLKGTYLLNQRVSCLRVNRNVALPEFIAYLLSSWYYQVYFINHANSSGGQANISPTIVKEVEIDLPSLVEQEAITAVLASLDDKIDLLHRQSITLESLAQTLFRHWFIDNASDDWEDGILGDLIELLYGKGLKSSLRTGEGYPVVGSNGIIDFHSEYLIEAPGIVIGRKGTLGEVIYLSDDFFPIDTTYFIRSKIHSPNLYFEYFLLKTINFKDMNTDSAVPGLNRNIALATEVAVPPQGEITKFNDLVQSLLEKIQRNNTQIRTLEKLRDTLLPKLMSGEVRVRQN